MYGYTSLSPPSEWSYMRLHAMGILAGPDFNHCLQRFGFLAGYPQKLTSYALRRGAANAVDCTVIPGEVKYTSLLIQPRPTGFGSPKEPDNGSRKG